MTTSFSSLPSFYFNVATTVTNAQRRPFAGLLVPFERQVSQPHSFRRIPFLYGPTAKAKGKLFRNLCKRHRYYSPLTSMKKVDVPKNNTIFSTALLSTTATILPDSTHVNIKHAPANFDPASAVVYPNFITHEEGQSFIKEASKRMKRRRFEGGHWDSVISLYREVELSTPADFGISADIDSTNTECPLFFQAIQRVRHHISTSGRAGSNSNEDDATNLVNSIKWLPCHAIDLHADGKLDAHVDSVKFSGEIVAGISLLSDSIMRLRPSSKEWEEEDGDDESSQLANKSGINNCDDSTKEHVDLFLPHLSLYVLSGMSRYSYTHELLLPGSQFEFSESNGESASENDNRCINVPRGRRLSIIFRDAHPSSLNQNNWHISPRIILT